MKTQNVIKLGIDGALAAAQFRRKANVWYRELDETVLVVELQKSEFGEQYYVNLGVLVKGLASGPRSRLPPRKTQCHVRLRLDSLKHGEEEQLKRLLDLEDVSVGSTERQQSVESLMKRIAVPFLLQCSSRSGLRDAHVAGQLSGALVHKLVRDSVLS